MFDGNQLPPLRALANEKNNSSSLQCPLYRELTVVGPVHTREESETGTELEVQRTPYIPYCES